MQHIISINKITLKLVETFIAVEQKYFCDMQGGPRMWEKPQVNFFDGYATLKYMFYSEHRTTIDIFPPFLFSVDIRDRDPNAAKRWSDETVFSNRAYFLFDKLPGELAVQNAKDSDTGNKFSYQLHFTLSLEAAMCNVAYKILRFIILIIS